MNNELPIPKMTGSSAIVVSYVVLVLCLAELTLASMLLMGKRIARWLVLGWCLVEMLVLTIALFAGVWEGWAQYILANILIALNLFKAYLLVLDKRTDRYFAERT